jgi:hypothetical protein
VAFKYYKQRWPAYVSQPFLVILTASFGLQWCVTSYAGNSDEATSQAGALDVSWTVTDLAVHLSLDGPLDSYDRDDVLRWHIYVPESYNPNKPAGLMVYISPTPSGRIRPDWRPVLDQENLIWISATKSGNNTPTRERILLASLAPFVAADRYEIDPDRVYLSGFSGGGKAAGIASIHLAGLFKGAIFICGAEMWKDVEAAHIATAAPNRYVFLTGSRDFNRTLSRETYKAYSRAGLSNLKLMVIRGMGHTTPDADHFREAIRYLDQRE